MSEIVSEQAPAERVTNYHSRKTDTLRQVRREEGRLYRMLYEKDPPLKGRKWQMAKAILCDIRSTLLAEAGTPVGAHASGSPTVNVAVLTSGTSKVDEIVAGLIAAREGRVVAEQLPGQPVLAHDAGAQSDGLPASVAAGEMPGD